MGEEKRRKKAGTYPYKKDTGIARLPSKEFPAGFPIREELRDNLNKLDFAKLGKPLSAEEKAAQQVLQHKPEFDTMTSAELQELKWSGIRQNGISRQTEIWLAGNIMKRLDTTEVARNPSILASAFEEIFGLPGHLIEMDVGQTVTQPAIFKNPH